MPNHIYSFKITSRQEILLLSPIIIFWTVLIIAIKFVKHGDLLGAPFLITVCIFFLIDTLPTLIVHTQYWLKNRGADFVVNTEGKELIYQQSGKELKYSFSDIAKLEYFRAMTKGSGWHSFGQYRYYKITFHDDVQIYITCLMINRIEYTLEMLLRMKAESHAKLLNVLR